MAILHVKDSTKGKVASADSVTTSFSTLPSAGNSIVVFIANYDGGTPDIPAGGVTDNQGVGNVYTRGPNVLEGGTGQNECCIFYCHNIGATSGTFTITVNPTGTTSYIVAGAAEFSGLLNAAPDKTQTNFGTSTTPTSGTTLTTTQADELVVAAASVDASNTNIGLTTPSGFANVVVEQDSQNFNALSGDWKIVSTTGTQSAAWGTIAVSAPWIAVIATFKAASTGSAAVGSRSKKNTIHPGRHPDRFGRHIRTKRNNITPASSVTGTAAITNGNDSVAGAGTTTIQGSAAITDGNDTVSASGSVTQPQGSRRAKTPVHPGRGPYNLLRFKKSTRNTSPPIAGVSGSAAITEARDTVVAAGTSTIVGSAAISNGNDTVTGTGSTANTGSAAITNGNDTVTAAGTTKILGSASITNGDDTVAASGTTKILGTAAITNGNDAVSASGSPVDVGSASIANGNDTVAASGSSGNPVGTANITNGDDTLAASGVVTVPVTPSANVPGQIGDPRPRREHWPKQGIGYEEEFRLLQEAEQAEQAEQAEAARAAKAVADAAKALRNAKKAARVSTDADTLEAVAAREAAYARALEDQEIQRAIAELLQEDEDAMNLIMSVL